MIPIHSSLLETMQTAIDMIETHNKKGIAITMTKEEVEHLLKVLQTYTPARSH